MAGVAITAILTMASCYHPRMRWPGWYPTRSEILGVLFAVVIIGICAVVMVHAPDIQQGANAGFGPDWVCTPQAQGGPTCIKKPSR
jgi:hypothetical protein